jgi:predicted nucleotidyltransferase
MELIQPLIEETVHPLENFRLDDEQKAGLKNLFSFMLENETAFLFGSRVDLSKKGGDVDILIFSERNYHDLSLLLTVKYQDICDERIDVVVMNPSNLKKENISFLKMITKVRIK